MAHQNLRNNSGRPETNMQYSCCIPLKPAILGPLRELIPNIKAKMLVVEDTGELGTWIATDYWWLLIVISSGQ